MDRVVLGIRRFCVLQPLAHLGGQFRLRLLHPLVAHRLVLRSVGLDLRPVQRDMPQLYQTGLLAQLQHLHEQAGQGVQVTSAELRDGPEIGAALRCHRHEVKALFARPCQPPRRIDPAAVPVQQQRRHHPRIKRRIAAYLVIAVEDRRQIQVVADHVADEVRHMSGRYEFLHRTRQQLRLMNLPGAECLAHARSESCLAPGVHRDRRRCRKQ